MKKIILSLAVVAFIAVGTISVSASTLTQDPQKKEVKKVETKVADKKECSHDKKAETKVADKKECCETAKTCDPKKIAKKKKN